MCGVWVWYVCRCVRCVCVRASGVSEAIKSWGAAKLGGGQVGEAKLGLKVGSFKQN